MTRIFLSTLFFPEEACSGQNAASKADEAIKRQKDERRRALLNLAHERLFSTTPSARVGPDG